MGSLLEFSTDNLVLTPWEATKSQIPNLIWFTPRDCQELLSAWLGLSAWVFNLLVWAAGEFSKCLWGKPINLTTLHGLPLASWTFHCDCLTSTEFEFPPPPPPPSPGPSPVVLPNLLMFLPLCRVCLLVFPGFCLCSMNQHVPQRKGDMQKVSSLLGFSVSLVSPWRSDRLSALH